jgi:high-affinity nickel-transport protein
MDASASTSLWVTLGLLTALGFRHGLDPDHIAAVDGLTRMRYRESAGKRPPVFGVARLAGFQFACGHSLNIFLVTLVFYWQDFELPQWLESTGLWLSTAFLLWLAFANLRQCWLGHPHTHGTSPAQRLIMRVLGPLAHPLGVGFAFAISFDALAQAGLMAAKGHELGGFGVVLLLALGFGLGMVLADTANGWLTHTLVQRSEHLAQQAGRWMSGLVGVLALAVVLVSHGSQHLPLLATLLEAWGAWMGLSVTATLLALYAVSRWYVQRPIRLLKGDGLAPRPPRA